MHEDIVDAFDDAVTIDPKVLAVDVVPISVDPNPAWTDRNLLLGQHDLRGRRGQLRGSDGLGLLNDDDGLPVDLLRRPLLGLDNHIVRRGTG